MILLLSNKKNNLKICLLIDAKRCLKITMETIKVDLPLVKHRVNQEN